MTLAEIQKKLKAPKNQHNNFGNYNYRSCEDILEAVKPLLDDMWLTINDEIVPIGNRYYIKATATLHGTDTEISVSAYAREEETKKGMDASQITGSASSYARKYALNGLFLIDDTKDADTRDNSKETVKEYVEEAQKQMPSEVAMVTSEQYALLKGKTTKKLIQDTIGRSVNSLKDLTLLEAEKLITEVNELGKE